MAENIPLEIQPVMHEIGRGMELKKCRKCGCMKDALDGAALAFASSEAPDVQALLPLLSTYMGHIQPSSTMWYLSASPELLALAAQRRDRISGAGS